jgi:hypothetical protein
MHHERTSRRVKPRIFIAIDDRSDKRRPLTPENILSNKITSHGSPAPQKNKNAPQKLNVTNNKFE